MGVEPIDERFAAFGWDVQRIDGHDFDAILGALGELAPAGDRPPAADRRRHDQGPRRQAHGAVAATGMSPIWSARTMTMPLPKSAPVCSRAQLRRTRMAKRRAKQRKPENTQGQDAIFRGTSGGDATLKDEAFKDQRSVRGTPNAALPAFVLGEELADLADRDPRIVVLDRRSRHRQPDQRFPRPPSRPLLRSRHRREEHDDDRRPAWPPAAWSPMPRPSPPSAPSSAPSRSKTDCAYPAMKVRLVGHHSGMSMGFYGTSHHALEDLAIAAHHRRPDGDLRHAMPITCARSCVLRSIIRAPCISVSAAGAIPQVYPEVPRDFRIGKAATLRRGKDLAIIACGSMLRATLDAADLLSKQGIEARVIDMHTIKPLDAAAIRKAARETAAVMTVEEHNITGGLGSAVTEVLVGEERVPFQRHGIPDEFVPVGPPAALYAHYKLDAAGIARKAKAFVAAAERR